MSKYPQPLDHAKFPAIARNTNPLPVALSNVQGREEELVESESEEDKGSIGEKSPGKQIVSREKAKVPIESAVVLAPRSVKKAVAMISKLRVVDNTSPSRRSQSFNNHDEYGTAITADRHFNFAPGIDTISITWKVSNPDRVEKVRLELYAHTDRHQPVWMVEHGGDQAREFVQRKVALAQGSHTGCMSINDLTIPRTTIGTDGNAFPDGCVTVEHGPYQLKMTVVSADWEATTVAWTYFDVLVHSIDLHWGTADMIPTADRTDIKAGNNAFIKQAEKDILAALSSGVKEPTDPHHDIHLVSNVFCQSLSEYEDNTFYQRYKDLWGLGPRIPLVAQVYIRKCNGDGVCSEQGAIGLGHTKFLWDWEDETEHEAGRINATYADDMTRGFIRDTLNYKLAGNGEAPPGSDNCHRDHGGKRGGEPVFPAQHADADPGAIVGEFPFKVIPCARRKWGAFSFPRTSGTHACYTGVIFQPSRMAKDTYRVSVYLARNPAIVDTLDAARKLRHDNPDLPRRRTGSFEVWRKVQARYIRKSNNTPRMDTAHAADLYRRAGLVFEYLDVNQVISKADHDRYLDEYLNVDNTPSLRDIVKEYLDHGVDQYTGGTAVDPPNDIGLIFLDWKRLYGKHLAVATESYARQVRTGKNNIRRDFDRFVPQYKLDNAGSTDDEAKVAWLATQPTLAQTTVKSKAEEAMRDMRLATTEEMYIEDSKSKAMNALQTIAGKYQDEHINTPGTAFFHWSYPFAFRAKDGSLTTPKVAGLAPSHRAQRSGGTQGVFLCAIPAHDIPTEMNPKDVAAHEIAHNMFLVHAPFPPGITEGREAPGYSEAHHVKDDDCLMNYIRLQKHICGFCLLRLRGWSYLAEDGCIRLSNVGAQNIK